MALGKKEGAGTIGITPCCIAAAVGGTTKIGLVMPLARYFFFTGSVLLALLFLTDWFLPSPAVGTARADIDRSPIRVHSLHKWPSAVVFDTNQPTIVPAITAAYASEVPPAPAEPAKSPQEALAMVPPKEPASLQAAPAALQKRTVRRSKVARAPVRAPRVASYETFGFGSPFQMSW